MSKENQSRFGVYEIKNLINNNLYIGSTSCSFNKRWNSWKNVLRRGKSHNKHLQRAWDKYGEENFVFEILEIVAEILEETAMDKKKRVLEREQYYLNNLKPEYNKSKIATSSLGFTLPEQGKLKAKHHPVFKSPEFREKIRNITKGQWEDGTRKYWYRKPWNKGMTQDRKCKWCDKPVKKFYKLDGSFKQYSKICGMDECHSKSREEGNFKKRKK